MRPVVLASLVLASSAACTEPDSEIVPAQVNWMEWPAEVQASEAFTVRLVGYGAPCREVLRFDPGTSVDNSAVTFEPFFLVSRHPTPCPLDARVLAATQPPIIAPYFDTRAPVSGLVPQTPRSYEIRAGTDVSVQDAATPTLPVRTFGEVIVRSGTADASRMGAGGIAYAQRDLSGCVTMYVGIQQIYVLENPPADTVTYWSGFVRGYLYKAAAPVCGADTVFHLVSRG
jgi:hypothetical protein